MDPKEEIVQSPPQSSRKFYSPLVKSIAKKENINLSELDAINGSGHNGRVNKSDILNYINYHNDRHSINCIIYHHINLSYCEEN